MKLINGMEFENDEKVIGKWDFFCNLNNIEEFNCKKQEEYNEKGFKEIYFMPNGLNYWIFEGWTKGKLLISRGGDDPISCFDYETKQIENDLFMFIHVKENGESYICVLKKVSSKTFKISDFVRTDDINIPFVFDEKVLGKWKSVDYLEKIEDFNGENPDSKDLWLKTIEFFEDGKVVRTYFNGKQWHDKWSKGKLIDLTKNVVSNYILKTINGEDFMIMEWKMGNYIYAGMDPEYYVFKKIK